MSNFAKIIQNNLDRLYSDSVADLEKHLPCTAVQDHLLFEAFGAQCRVTPGGIFLDGQLEDGPRGIVVSLYALHHHPDPPLLEPFRAFKELPGSQPYAGAFARQTETILVPHVPRIESRCGRILKAMAAADASGPRSGDFSLLLRPLPKIFLYYICYRADEDFAASVTCLFSYNALRFLPLDGLADAAEYTSRRILELVDWPSAAPAEP